MHTPAGMRDTWRQGRLEEKHPPDVLVDGDARLIVAAASLASPKPAAVGAAAAVATGAAIIVAAAVGAGGLAACLQGRAAAVRGPAALVAAARGIWLVPLIPATGAR